MRFYVFTIIILAVLSGCSSKTKKLDYPDNQLSIKENQYTNADIDIIFYLGASEYKTYADFRKDLDKVYDRRIPFQDQ